MGSSPSQYCNYLVNMINNNDYIFNEHSHRIKAAILIQSVFRGYFYRRMHPELFIAKISLRNNNNNIQLNSTSSVNREELNVKEVGLNYSIETIEVNATVQKLKQLIPKFELDDKEKYIISTSNLKKKGLLYIDGSIYKGMVSNILSRECFGIYYFNNGNIYEGFFVNDNMEGRGRIISVEGFVYEGDFQNNTASGYGKCLFEDGSLYKGNWVNNNKQGLGEETYPDGSSYIGNFVNGKKNGRGKLSFPDGNSYEGEFWNNEIKGEGLYKFKDGRIYMGHFFNNKMNGYGIFKWPDNTKYYGHYDENKKNGFGAFFWVDGKKYEGFWKDGKQDGFGYIKENNIKSYGEWSKGKKMKDINDAHEKKQIQNSIKRRKEEFDYQSFKIKIDLYEKEIGIK